MEEAGEAEAGEAAGEAEAVGQATPHILSQECSLLPRKWLLLAP